jgi:hypothetical protein
MAVYAELFSPVGVTVGNLSPRGSQKFDAIRTTKDLGPDPARARTGDVVTPDGKPAAGAQVVVLPIADRPTVMLSGAQLRDPLDEQWILTDAAGRFTVYPNEDECWIVSLHPSGFSLQRGPAKGEHRTTRLQPWATVTFTSTGEIAGQSAHINAYPTGTGSEGPYFDVYGIKAKSKPIDVKVPAGKIIVSRSLEMKEGVAIATPVETISLSPGEQRNLEVAPANAAERAAASDEFDNLHGAKKSDAKTAPATKPPPHDKPASDTAPPVTADQKPSAAPKVQDSDELLELKRKAAPLLATMAKEHGYKLDANQNLRRVAPPFPAIRMEWYRVAQPAEAKAIPAGPNALVFRWSQDKLTNWGATFSANNPPTTGYRLSGLLDALIAIKTPMIDGPSELLDTPIPGDWIVPMGANNEQIIKELGAILRNELSMRVSFEFRTIDRPVYVVDGVYQHKPVPGGRDKVAMNYANKTVAIDAIEVFANQLAAHNRISGGSGTFPEFLNELGGWIRTPIVSNVKAPLQAELSFTFHYRSPFTNEMEAIDHDPALVLANITAQTGLSFRKETRRVRILFVSRD